MPSLEHEAILELFRRAPNLVSEAIRAAFDIHLPEEPGKPVESTLGQLAPTEYHADLVVAFGEIRVIVEVQLRRDPEKRWTWPLYVTTLAARERCSVYLLVVTNSEDVARWAERPIPLGNPGSWLVPLVIGPESFPTIASWETARRHPELAVLSAILHAGEEPDLEALTAVTAGLMALEKERATIYTDLVLRSAGGLARQIWERLMSAFQGYEFKSEIFREILARGLAEGREKGLAEGREKGLAEGREKGLAEGEREGRIAATAEAVVKVLAKRGISLSEAERATIQGTRDLPTLEEWLDRALVVTSAAELLQGHPTAPAKE